MKWSYDACGIYFIYRKYIVINRNTPGSNEYSIYKESSDLSLIFKGVASTITLAKTAINELIENGI